MDTMNPGEELLVRANQMQQNAEMQHAEQEEVQGFQRQTFFAEHPVLSEEELDRFREEQTGLVQDFLHTYRERVAKAAAPVEPDATKEEKAEAKAPVVVSAPVQEEPDEKTLKKQQKQREKKINEGKKKGILAANEYSIDIQKSYSTYLKKKETPEYRQGKDAQFWQEYISRFEISPTIGDPVYVGQNPMAAQEYLDNLKEAVDYFTLQNPELLSTMTLTFQQKVGSAMKTYPLLEAAYDNALMKNGLKRHGSRLVPIDGNDLLKLRSDEDIRQSLVEQEEKNKTELDAVIAKEVDIYAKEKMRTELAAHQDIRDEYKAKESTSYIETERINNRYHFEALDLFSSMLEAHPEKYAAHKEVLDSIMVYVRNMMEAVPLYTTDTSFVKNIPANKEPEVIAAIYDWQDKADFKKDDLQETIIMAEMALKHILEDKPIYDRMAEFLYQFGYASPEYLVNRQKTVDDAMLYADTYKLKTAIWESLLDKESKEVQEALKADQRAFMLMQIEDTEEAHRYNQEVVEAKKYALEAESKTKTQEEKDAAQLKAIQLYKPKFQALYDKVMNTELESLRKMEPEELMRRQKEFLSIGMENMHLNDACKLVDPITQKSIKESVFPSPEFGEMYRLKIIMIQNYMVMGRTLYMMEAYKKDALTSDMLANDTEMLKLERSDVIGTESDKVLGVAQESYKVGRRMAAGAQKLLDEAYKNYVMVYYQKDKKQPDAELAPVRIEDKISEVMSEGDTQIARDSVEEIRGVYYNLIQAGRQEDADLVEAWQGLKKEHYHLAGEKKEINEPLFRSFIWAGRTKGLKDMPEAEFRSMVKLLAAGHLEMSKEEMEQTDMPAEADMEHAETQADFQAKNKEGLRKLLHAITPHLDYLEEKYGYEVPQYEYVVAHMDEVMEDFQFGQVTENIVQHFDVLDSNNPEEARLMQQIHFYNEIGMKVVSLFSLGALEDDPKTDKLKRIRECRNTKEVATSLDYLKTHPKTAVAGE